ncbi:MAG: LysR family transcriptional regulator [Pseudotabrizicola sp.]|uniref:LysR family transcriptional regulator n=1 Tax=Pseudotabrizicola sp. TaxID=2939647 RepID=UPI002717D0A4|nr:LysR family transcriptional regulator [Pseudotabrizicola sp.]MDO8883713.1 LysR family transcriptional regulator [Pseudotabrizicola sp.]MDP2079652.1 LysR family transcriptional regulator [Pseudotabrizicola sp.]MDZ7574585.1 LysR family transcriptional regulator [Pseudotabrizicola sp.]
MKHLQDFAYIEAVMQAGSIRKAADDMNITASALNRRIQRFEEEFGSEIFERLPRGVRLNPAGEMLVQHFRAQVSDLRRVQSQVADLSGIRRGHVSVACSQALIPYFMPEQIARYRVSHPGVTFSVSVRDREAAERDLSTFRSDLALVFEPILLVDFEVLMSAPQTICVLMRDDHPLAGQSVLRLRDCLDHPHVVPTRQYGVRHLLDVAAARGTRAIAPVVEADSFDFMRHYVIHENAIAFQIPIGLRLWPDSGMVALPLSSRDVPSGNLLLGQMRGRTLPVASARFAQSLRLALEAIA